VPAIQHAVEGAAAPSRRDSATLLSALRKMPAVSLAAAGFALLQVPLALIAIAFGWRTTWGTPDEPGPIVGDLIAYGSAISGPLAPQVVLLALALVACRRRLRHVAAVGIGLIGALVVFNGGAEALSDPVWTPRPVLIASGALFVTLGGVLVATSAATLFARHARKP
jgi:hypothetical protein